ncbi:hypothetical protein Lalb_Chr15g0080011 [Lupinus albus]|uniref:Uncharacterized protein n=1 Tax=Lupinus albus TaxID=3870 RepID=A0A6A4PE95_LUPAL|nr:hypothetical protein Lalb_Chr15g0080011 [Lupinus albus]
MCITFLLGSNEDMFKECKSLSLWTKICNFTNNAGLGPPLEEDNNPEGVFSEIGWYATNQFDVDVVVSNRMLLYLYPFMLDFTLCLIFGVITLHCTNYKDNMAAMDMAIRDGVDI